MTKCNTRSKTMQLHLINHAVFNSLNNNELLLAFEKQGISRSVFEDGKSIYEQAISARAAEIAIEDDLHEADMYLKKLQKSIHDEYIKFTEAAKMSFGRNTLDMLGIQKKLPRSETSLIDSAQKSIHIFNEHPELMKYLSKNEFDETKVAFVSLIIQSYEQVNKDKDMLKKQLVTASEERTSLFSQVVTWLENFASHAIPAVVQEPHLIENLGLSIDDLYAITGESSVPVPENCL